MRCLIAVLAFAFAVPFVTVSSAIDAGAATEAVQSAAIDKVSYNPDTQVLTVAFDKGGTYEYSGVSQEVYDALMKAESKGTYLSENIRGKFEAKKIAD